MSATLIDEPTLSDAIPTATLVTSGQLPPRRPSHFALVAWRVATKTIWTVFCFVSLVGLLAVITAIPFLQIASLGYLLTVAGRLARGGTVRDCLPELPIAGRLGLALVALALLRLPIQLLVHWAAVANIVSPNSTQTQILQTSAVLAGLLGGVALSWAWLRGGRLVHYLWPQPKRFFRQYWRLETWQQGADHLWQLVAQLSLPSWFWLGLRGMAGTLIWLIPAMLIMGVTREADGDGAGVLFAILLLALGAVLLYLPMLQVHFATEDSFRAIFQWRNVRRHFSVAPWSWSLSMLIGLVLMPIPLYLLKIEATPQEITWLPCLVFVSFMLPARIAEGLAMRRCRRLTTMEPQTPPSQSRWRRIWVSGSRWFNRLILMPAIVAIYLGVLTASQYTSWDGIETWLHQHALLVPVPFVGV
ncbi:MAG: DUF4013 domain-containing protein [Planctomycetota bacterium]